MSRLDCGAADVKAALEDVSTPTSKNEWAVFGYVPKSGNVIKVDSKGSGFDDLVEEFSEGKVQFAYYRVMIKNVAKFVYVAWCGDGVAGMAKGSFGNHSNDMGAHLKKAGFAVHHQLNARATADLDEKKIQAALVKAAGANYDAGAKKQGQESVNKAMGDLKTFHISEQQRVVQDTTGRDEGASGVNIDKGASDSFWQQNKAQSNQPAAQSSKPAVDESARKQFWAKQQEEQAAAKASAAKQPPASRPAINEDERKAYWQQDQQAKASSARPAPGGAPPAAPGASAARAKFQTASTAPPPSNAPPPGRPAPAKAPSNPPPAAGGRPAPGGAPPSLPPSNPPPANNPPPPANNPPPPVSAPPPARPPPAAAAPPLPPPQHQPEPEPAQDEWADTSAGQAEQGYEGGYAQDNSGYAQQEEAQQDYSQQGYAQEEYAQQEYSQEGYAQEEYAQPTEATGQEEYAQQEYSQEGYAQEEYAQNGQEEYAQQGYDESQQYEQVQALHDYAGSHAEDLSFAAGDWITVYEKDESGWWKGALYSDPSRTGYFPSNFVQANQ